MTPGGRVQLSPASAPPSMAIAELGELLSVNGFRSGSAAVTAPTLIEID